MKKYLQLLIVLVLKAVIMAINVGAKIPCGIFIPMLAIGACIGAVLNHIWLKIDPEIAPFCDLLVAERKVKL
jgi:H+/Cl- antiporter ClcA